MYPRSHSEFKQSTYQPKFRVLTNQVFRVWDQDGDSVSDLERQVLLSRRTETELRIPKSSCLYAISLSYSHQIVKVIKKHLCGLDTMLPFREYIENKHSDVIRLTDL